MYIHRYKHIETWRCDKTIWNVYDLLVTKRTEIQTFEWKITKGGHSSGAHLLGAHPILRTGNKNG